MKRLQLFFKRIFSFVLRKIARKFDSLTSFTDDDFEKRRYIEVKCKRRRYWKPKKFVLV